MDQQTSDTNIPATTQNEAPVSSGLPSSSSRGLLWGIIVLSSMAVIIVLLMVVFIFMPGKNNEVVPAFIPSKVVTNPADGISGSAALTAGDDIASLEKDVNGTNLNNLDLEITHIENQITQ